MRLGIGLAFFAAMLIAGLAVTPAHAQFPTELITESPRVGDGDRIFAIQMLRTTIQVAGNNNGGGGSFPTTPNGGQGGHDTDYNVKWGAIAFCQPNRPGEVRAGDNSGTTGQHIKHLAPPKWHNRPSWYWSVPRFSDVEKFKSKFGFTPTWGRVQFTDAAQGRPEDKDNIVGFNINGIICQAARAIDLPVNTNPNNLSDEYEVSFIISNNLDQALVAKIYRWDKNTGDWTANPVNKLFLPAKTAGLKRTQSKVRVSRTQRRTEGYKFKFILNMPEPQEDIEGIFILPRPK